MNKKRGKYRKNFIKEIREEKKVSLEMLSDLVGMTNQQVSNIELSKSRLSIDQLDRFADALGCHHLDIIHGPGHFIMPLNKKQEEALRAMQEMDDREQEVYLNTGKAFISGRNTEEQETDNPGKKRGSQ